MNIVPTPSGPQARDQATRLRGATPGASARERTPEGVADEARDRVEISPEALELHGGPSSSTPELPAARMRSILDRMSNGYYDRVDVQAAVLERIARDPGFTTL